VVEVSRQDDSILDAALRAGADLPYACKGGVCATCKCKIIAGKVDMAVNYSLEEDEIAQGYVLSCQARPVTANVRLSFDE
jgi:ring-1,2-phenylacetyl-CoA epoxidase subunit PaaE